MVEFNNSNNDNNNKMGKKKALQKDFSPWSRSNTNSLALQHLEGLCVNSCVVWSKFHTITNGITHHAAWWWAVTVFHNHLISFLCWYERQHLFLRKKNENFVKSKFGNYFFAIRRWRHLLGYQGAMQTLILRATICQIQSNKLPNLKLTCKDIS